MGTGVKVANTTSYKGFIIETIEFKGAIEIVERPSDPASIILVASANF